MRNNLKRLRNSKSYVIVIGIFVILLPFLLLAGSHKLHFLNSQKFDEDMHEYFFNWKTGIIFLRAVGIIGVAILAAITSTALLFNLSILQGHEESIKSKWYWKPIIRHLVEPRKHLYQLLLGYLIAIIFLNPLAGRYIVEGQQIYEELGIKIEKVNFYQAMAISLPMITVTLFFARYLSRIERVQIMGSNIGIFIVAIYMSQLIFDISLGTTPLDQFLNIIGDNAEHTQPAVEVYFMEIVTAFSAAVFDHYCIQPARGKATTKK